MGLPMVLARLVAENGVSGAENYQNWPETPRVSCKVFRRLHSSIKNVGK